MNSAEAAAIGLLAVVVVMLALIRFGLRSRARRPPPRPVVLPSRAGSASATYGRPATSARRGAEER